jgi:hypothetical protein
MTVYQRAVLGQVWVDYTPTLAGFTIGNGTITSRYMRIGSTVFVDDRIVFGTTSTFGAAPTLTLPSTPVDPAGWVWFDGTVQASATSNLYVMRWRASGGTGTVGLAVKTDGGTGGVYAQLTPISSTIPLSTWGTGYRLTRRGFYEEA